MGLYLNPNGAYFEEVAASEMYVDKTMLIAKLNALLGTSEKFICVSRPRRFGKTIAGAMIASLFRSFKRLRFTQGLCAAENCVRPDFSEKPQ